MNAKTILVPIKERVRLNPHSLKETYHIVLNLENTSFTYEVGDCVGIYPTNESQSVEQILSSLQSSGEEEIVTRDGERLSLRHFLTHRASLQKVTKKLSLSVGSEPHFAEIDVVQLLEKKRISLPNIQPFVEALLPMMPRFYSIASSQKWTPEELHLTVALTAYEKEGEKKFGVCSRYLCHHAPLHQPNVPIYLHKAKDFVLSRESVNKPIIMIGPGTGIAPFRGFLQERALTSNAPNWLFFGERNEKTDFYYRDYFEKLDQEKKLILSTAFSRDQEHKIYVWHKMLESAPQLWEWISQGALLYVCGDATRMAKDVEVTLLSIFQQEGKMDPIQAKEFLKTLRNEKRYLRDVY